MTNQLEIKLLSENATMPTRANECDSGLEPICIRNNHYSSAYNNNS